MNTFEFKDMARSVLLVGLKGATVDALDGDGRVIASCGFQAGVHKLSQLAPYFQGAESVRVDGADVFIQGAVMQRIRGPLHYATGANPDFVPRSQYDQTLQADLLIKKLSKQSRALDKRMKAIEAADSRVKSQVVEREEPSVIEKGDDDGKAQVVEKVKAAKQAAEDGDEPEGSEVNAGEV